MMKNNHWQYEGNAKYEGFCVDLLEKLSESLSFTYEIYRVPDGNYGSQNKEDGTWNGMIGEILAGVRAF